MTEPEEPGYLPIAEVLPTMTMWPLPEGYEAETVYMLVKLRKTDTSGGPAEFSWGWRSPEIVNHEELLGALISQTDLIRRQMLDMQEDA